MMPKNLRIDKMIYGGDALAHLEGNETSRNTMTIPFVLPRELVQLTTEKTENEISILEPSANRIEPACIHFGSCGGCHYQHATYAAQLAIKRNILHDTLQAVGLERLPEIDTHSAEPWHYRNRIRLRVGFIDGELRIGYNRHGASGGDPLLPITMCSIAAPLLWQAAKALTTLIANPLLAASSKQWFQAAVEIELFTDARQKKLQLTLFVRNPPNKGFADFCGALKEKLPELIGAGVAILPTQISGRSRRTERPKVGATWGAPGMLYDVVFVDDTVNEFWITRGAFFQVNIFVIETLAQIVTSGRTGTLAWDLYAGVGLFSRILADHFQQVVAVEASEPAAANLKAALASAPNGKNHRTFASTTLDFLGAAVVQRERPDLIVMDPPRAGVGPEVCSLLARIRSPQLVYVSCDPVTLARDLKLLTDAGYTLSALHLVDMFPQTFHMESVAILHR